MSSAGLGALNVGDGAAGDCKSIGSTERVQIIRVLQQRLVV
jgi:hypothetical protein